jgi:hypothetical protein
MVSHFLLMLALFFIIHSRGFTVSWKFSSSPMKSSGGLLSATTTNLPCMWEKHLQCNCLVPIKPLGICSSDWYLIYIVMKVPGPESLTKLLLNFSFTEHTWYYKCLLFKAVKLWTSYLHSNRKLMLLKLGSSGLWAPSFEHQYNNL